MHVDGGHFARRVGVLALLLIGCQSAELPAADATSGFQVSVDGFSFPNFGGDSTSARLTAPLVARLFGEDAVCAGKEFGQCRLTPLAAKWMEKVNGSMRGGRCEGFAVLSGLFYGGDLAPADFGAADAFDLQVSNGRLAPEIAYWFSTQFLRDVVKESTRTLQAREAVEFLSNAYRKTPVPELYRVGMVKVGENGKATGGHAMVATAVLVDAPGKRFRIEVYDNNHPGEPRYIQVDAEANTWSYQASSNPDEAASLYQGNATNKNPLYLATIRNRTGLQRCSFCGKDAEDGDAALNQIFSFGSIEVAAADEAGRATGVVDGQFVNELPGAFLAPNFSAEPWQDPMPPILFLPARATAQGSELSFRVVGTGGSDPMHMTLFGPGRSVGISGTSPAPGTTDHVRISNGGSSVSVTRDADAGGAFTVTAITEIADGGQVEVNVTAAGDAGETQTAVQMDPSSGNAVVSASDGEEETPVEISIVRSSSSGDVVIEVETSSPPGGALHLNIDGYSRDAGALEVAVDQDGDGTPEMTVPVTNHGPSSPPAPPEALTAAAVAYNRVQLNWRDASRYETGFVVERSVGAGVFATLVELPAESHDYADTTVVALETYRYRVRAQNAEGASAWSNEATVDSPDCPTGSQDRDRDGVCTPSCAATTCDSNADCSDSTGRATCVCRSGFSGDGSRCVDVDECLSNNGGCGDAARWSCTNRVGAAPTCSDVDECLSNNGGCGDAARWFCTNNPGVAPTCSDIDECAVNNGACGISSRWRCTNNVGAAPTCSDIDECLTNNGGCGSAARWRCVNNTGVAPSCADIDECATNNGGCSQWGACVNRLGEEPFCRCDIGISGPTCTTRIEFITSALNPGSNETVSDLVRDAAGNLYAALQVDGPESFGNGVTTAAIGGRDVVLVSYGANGVARWAVVFGSTGNDQVSKLAIDSTGNLFVTGTAGASPFEIDSSHGLAQSGGFVVSVTPSGLFRWARSLATEARAVAVDPAGNIAVSGIAASPFDYGLGVQQANGSGDAFLASYTNDGTTTRWVKVYGSNGTDNAFDDLAFDSNGALFAAGHLDGSSGNLGGADLTLAGQKTAVLASYSNAGAHRWSTSFPPIGTGYADSASTELAVDDSGHVAAFFVFRDGVDLGGGPITTSTSGTAAGAIGLFATSTGTFVAQRTFVTGVPVMVFDLAYDATGELFVAGNANNAGADFGGGATHSGAFVAGYDSSLGYRFSKVASGGAYPSAQAVVPTGDGDLFAAGQFSDTTIDFGVGAVTEGAVGSDLWLARMRPHLPVSAGLVARFNAREPSSVVRAGLDVSTWNDGSGLGHSLSVATGTPTWLPSALNGRPALDFATDKGLVSQPFPLSAEVTVLVVASWPATAGVWGSLAHHGDRDDDWSLERRELSSNFHFQSNNDNSGVELSCSNDVPTLFVGRIRGSERMLRIVDPTGDRQITGQGVTIVPGAKLLWVGRSHVDESSNARIGELVYFDRALTDPELDAVIAELTRAWGIGP